MCLYLVPIPKISDELVAWSKEWIYLATLSMKWIEELATWSMEWIDEFVTWSMEWIDNLATLSMKWIKELTF